MHKEKKMVLSLAINTLVEHRNKGDDESLRQTTFAVQIIG